MCVCVCVCVCNRHLKKNQTNMWILIYNHLISIQSLFNT